MAVTKEQIFSAADNLAAAGQKPTFGGSGSCRARLQEQEFPSSLEGHWRNISGRKIRDITQGIDLASIEATCGIC